MGAAISGKAVRKGLRGIGPVTEKSLGIHGAVHVVLEISA
jgi:hypothetical protein